jgi:hypothetical protein
MEGSDLPEVAGAANKTVQDNHTVRCTAFGGACGWWQTDDRIDRLMV